MKWLSLLVLGLATSIAAASNSGSQMILVLGAPGTKEFAAQFESWARRWESAAQKAGVSFTRVGPGAEAASAAESDLEKLKKAIASVPAAGSEPLWLVFIGHGTFDGQLAKFNLAGPDIEAKVLADWVKGVERPLVIIDTASASAPFLAALSGKNRIIVTATRSGHEQNFARFGDYLSSALSRAEADLDQDGQISVLEAFLFASHELSEFYEKEGRLATEHPLLDDNGDGQGTEPDWFKGIRATKKPDSRASAGVDGLRAHQVTLVPSEEERKLPPEIRKRRNELELEVRKLQDQKASLKEEEYFSRLEKLLVEIARLYEKAEK